MAKKKDDSEIWIIENDDGSIIEFDDVVDGERDQDFDLTMTCYWKGKVVYSGKKVSHTRKDFREWLKKLKQENARTEQL